MSTPSIVDFLFDDENEEEMAAHGLTADTISQLLDHPLVVLRNRKERRAQYLIIGRDKGRRCIAVPVESTHDPTLWRPVTAWPCKDNERARLGKGT